MYNIIIIITYILCIYITGRPRFSEDDAARLLRPLLESVAYLHDLGIVHRGQNYDDIPYI